MYGKSRLSVITVVLLAWLDLADAVDPRRARLGCSRRCTLLSFVIFFVVMLLSAGVLFSSRMPVFPITTNDKASAVAAQIQVGSTPADATTKTYIVTFSKDKAPPAKVVDATMEKFKDIGGKITHKFDTLLIGFTVALPTEVLSTSTEDVFTTLQNSDYPFTFEEDQPVSINSEDA
ncbi:uncharacterized protein V1516DRAFT_669580 [Lipomyces oligophaga]|uniref:uncharacterized protein n=1 Tax=Lipomyces oligophaga TaxID=45792 RepID=UPI0034CE76A4